MNLHLCLDTQSPRCRAHLSCNLLPNTANAWKGLLQQALGLDFRHLSMGCMALVALRHNDTPLLSNLCSTSWRMPRANQHWGHGGASGTPSPGECPADQQDTLWLPAQQRDSSQQRTSQLSAHTRHKFALSQSSAKYTETATKRWVWLG